MGDPCGPGGFREGEGLEGANHKKKLKERSQKSEKFGKNYIIFFSIGTYSKPL